MKENKENRGRIVGIRFTATEFSKLEGAWKNSTARTVSDHLRDRIFNRPVVTKVRDASLDDLMAELSVLRTELNHIGNNFNQAVKRLHTLRDIPEWNRWIKVFEADKAAVSNKVSEIQSHVQKLAERWLRR